MMSEYEIKKQICDIGKRLYDRRMVAANDGDISVKISDNEYLCTPAGISKGFMTPECILKIDGDGNVLQANRGFKPSSEIKMHLGVYKKRPDVWAVVYAHPVYATSFAISGKPLTQPVMSQAVIELGCVPVVEYGTPSANESPDTAEKYFSCYDAVLLENDGALVYSDSLLAAYNKMESLEFYAELVFLSNQLGGSKELSKEQLKKIYGARCALGMKDKHPANLCSHNKNGGMSCHSCNVTSCTDAKESKIGDNNELIEQIAKKVIAKLGK